LHLKSDLLISRRLSAAEKILAMLWQAGEGTVNARLPEKYTKKYGDSSRQAYYSAVFRLRARGFIKQKNKKIFTLTPKGSKEALFSFINGEAITYTPKVPKTWDGGWRIILFDVPEKKRHYRDFLRRVIQAIGFREFQKSVWIYPHPVPSFLRDLLFEENIKKYTRFITTEEIEYDADLKNLFPEIFVKYSAK